MNFRLVSKPKPSSLRIFLRARLRYGNAETSWVSGGGRLPSPKFQTSVNDLVFDEGVSKFSSSDCGIFREHPNWLDFLRYR